MLALKSWATPLGLLAAIAAVGLVVRVLVSHRLKARLAQPGGRLNDLLVLALQRHLPLWFLLAGISAAAQASPLAQYHQELVHRLTVSCFVISVTFALSGFAAAAVRLYSAQFAASTATTSLSESLAQAGVYILGALLLLSNLGISVTPVLTALGVGSLAVALALQDTLNNLFSGISIVASSMVEVGQYVRLDSGFEGTVLDIGWRTTRIKDPADRNIVIPNAKLAQSVVVNYGRKGPVADLAVALDVPYDSDWEKVEAAALEAAAETQKSVRGAVLAFEPTARFTGYSDSAVTLTVALRAQTPDDKAALAHDFLKRIHARFARDGVAVPYRRREIRLIPGGKPL